jgi:hypothetical protein
MIKTVFDDILNQLKTDNDLNDIIYPNRLGWINNLEELKDLSISIKKDDPNTNMTLLYGSNIKNIYLLSPTNQIISFISFQLKSSESSADLSELFKMFKLSKPPILTNIDQYIYIVYSFTYTAYRGNRYNQLLRQIVEMIAKQIKISCIISEPLFGANSIKVLKRMNYINYDFIYYKLIFEN